MTKTYTVEESHINVTGGRYKSNSPMAAARKAATKLFKKAQEKASSKSLKKISFSIRETTSGSDKKIFAYVATRVKLAQPLVRVINGKEIVNKFKTEVKADKKANAAAKKAEQKRKQPVAKASPKVKGPKGRKVKGGNCNCDN